LLDQAEAASIHQRRIDAAHERDDHIHTVQGRADVIAGTNHQLVVRPDASRQARARCRKRLTAK
jgi:hypothetical protein